MHRVPHDTRYIATFGTRVNFWGTCDWKNRKKRGAMRADRLVKKERKIPAFARENSSNSISFIPSNVQLVCTYYNNKVMKNREKFRYYFYRYLNMVNRLYVRGFWIIKEHVTIKNER